MAIDKSMKVLVIDDFSTMRRITKSILKQLGFTNIIEADDGKSGLQILKTDAIGIIIADLNMPEMNGLELLKTIRADDTLKDLPFLIVTTVAQQENISEALACSMKDYIVKPFTVENLKQKIDQAFDR
ncbi:MAG: response regulator [Deltaproteobacteria bacterium]|nr:response regulator [Deltaproteobacteria bacterium]